MKKRILAYALAMMFMLLAACGTDEETTGSKESGKIGSSATKVTEYEFYAVNLGTESGANGFKTASSAGLVTESGKVRLDVSKNRSIRHYGSTKALRYQYTEVEDKNSESALDNYNRGYDVYACNNELEYSFLHGTRVVCGYRDLYGTGTPENDLNNMAYKTVADEFLYNVMPQGWKIEYEDYSFEPSENGGNFVARYTRLIEGCKTDDVLTVEVYPWGEVCSFEGYGRNKYDDLQNTVTADMLQNAEAALEERIGKLRLLGTDLKEATIVTNNKGELYLKKQISFSDSGRPCTDTVFVKIVADKLKMSAEYKAMIEANFENNKKIDADSKTTTRNRIINDQNGSTVSQFKYGSFDASYNSCGAIAVHNAKVMLGEESTLSETIYDIQSTSGLALGGMFGSNHEMVPDVMKKYGIKCTEAEVSRMDTVGVYIISFWHENPPWNGTHTVALYYDGRKYIAYNLKGDGTVNTIVPSSFGDRMIKCYKLG